MSSFSKTIIKKFVCITKPLLAKSNGTNVEFITNASPINLPVRAKIIIINACTIEDEIRFFVTVDPIKDPPTIISPLKNPPALLATKGPIENPPTIAVSPLEDPLIVKATLVFFLQLTI